ncbi:MAG: phage baseplate protein [Candidatus Competibacteraceae bacterium]
MNQPPARRAWLLLAAACPETKPETLAGFNIGRRDACLLTLREWTFGPHLESVVNCPACSERMEFKFAVADIRVEGDATLPDGKDTDSQDIVLNLERSGYRVCFRLPNSRDLLGLSENRRMAGDLQKAYAALLARCLLAVERDGTTLSPVVPGELPPELIAAVVERMAQADPQADVMLSLHCPACRHQWQASFDIVMFFWQEIDAWAQRLLDDVHTLAAAYGWREADILAFSPYRRQCYLDRVRG